MKTTIDPMAEWKNYCNVFNAGASRTGLMAAAKAMKDGGNRKAALMNLGVMTASDKKQVAARWASINAVTEKEIAAHCQFSGFFTAQ
jgi:hypothetical protein